MSTQEPPGPYVFQPYGSVDSRYAGAGRLWGVSGLSPLATIVGLTKREAEAIVAALRKAPEAAP